MGRLLVHGIALLVMGGCVLPKPAPPSEPLPKVEAWRGEVAADASDADLLIQYSAYVRRLSAAEVLRELENVKQTVAKNHDMNRLRLAILYGLPSQAVHDDAKCLAALEPVIKESNSVGLRNFALLLQALVADNKRLSENGQTLALKLREEQKQSEQLQQKLEALKSIEKSLIGRDGQQPK
jgi:predicted RNase H-like nuclease (RuvC/YqgF family)